MPKGTVALSVKNRAIKFKLLDTDLPFIGCFRNLISTAYTHEGWFLMHTAKNDVIAVDFIVFVRLIAFLLHD